jgi:hypothetical protein
MDDTVKRKLLYSKWNDSHILKFPSRYHKLEKKQSFLIVYYIIIYDNETCIT